MSNEQIDHKIECNWYKKGFLDIGQDGQVFPCCMFEFGYYVNLEQGSDLAQYYIKHSDEFNIHNHPLEDIMKHPFFTEMLPESWADYDTALPLCKRNCTAGEAHGGGPQPVVKK